MSIEIRSISKDFGTFCALGNVSLQIDSGELVALLGPSGCGKTTLLRIIAGLETADRGYVLLNGLDVTDADVRDRKVGFVFQHYALFRHMNVFDNIAFGLRMMPRAKRPPKAAINTKVTQLLGQMQLERVSGHYPAQLSGGQRQRVALARALAVEPQVLLLDEPFGALDAKVRKELRRWLRRLHEELHITSVFVTHDQDEAFEVADRVALMNAGHIEQTGTPQDVWHRPQSPFACSFLGDANRFYGQIHQGMMQIGSVGLACPQYHDVQHAKAVVYVREHDLDVSPNTIHTYQNGVVATLMRSVLLGPTARLELLPQDETLMDKGQVIEVQMDAQQWTDLNIHQGDTVVLTPRNWHAFVLTPGPLAI